jgi:hypothetical protein
VTFLVATRPARRVQLGTVRRAGRWFWPAGGFVMGHPRLEATESIGAEPAKERRVTPTFGLCRAGGARKAPELRKFSGDAFR